MNSERRLDYGKLLAIGVIALLGLTLMGGALFAPKTVSGAPGVGIQAIVTSRSCDFVQLEQQPYAVCDDGSQWRVEKLPFAESPPASQ